MQLTDAKKLAQEAWDRFRGLPPDSVEMRLLVAFIREIGDCRENVESEIKTALEAVAPRATMAEIDAALGAVCKIGSG